MNYYEHHLGDYAEATGHLSFVEDAAYSRLMRKVYATEKPLPAELKDVQRLAGARTREERAAVETVLNEFFVLGADGWQNARCDAEIARYQDKQRKAKASADARWSHTERNANASPNAMRTHSEGNALQTPDTRHQEKKEKRAPSAPRAKRCPPDWVVPQDVFDAIAKECQGVDLDRETANFRDWEYRDAKTDWAAAWRRWMRKAATDLASRPTGETNYARSMREKYEQITPLIAAKAPGVRANPMDVIEGMTREPALIAR